MQTETQTETSAQDIDPKWLDLLRHTLGAGSHIKKRNQGYRNHFCAVIGSPDFNAFTAMVDRGFAEAGGTINGGRDQYFRATVAGCKLIRLSKAAIKRAFDW